MKNAAAVALGRMAKGVPKTLSAEQRTFRAATDRTLPQPDTPGQGPVRMTGETTTTNERQRQ